MRGYAGDEVGDGEAEWSNGIHPEDAPRVFAAVQAHFEGKSPVFAEEYRIRCKDGAWKWIFDRGMAQHDAAGRVVRMAGSETDITERKRLEEEARKLLATVQAEKDRLSALINSMNDEVWFADTDKRFSLANPRGLQEFGLGAVNVIDVEKMAAGLEVYRPDGTPRPVEEAPPLRALKGEVVRNQEEIIRTPSGSELRYREVNAAPVRDAGGNIIGSISVVRDITDRKRVEIDLRKSEEALRLANEHLEQRVRERTLDLQNLAEQLERSHQSLRKLASELVMAEERERKRVAGVLHDDIAQTLAAAKMRIDMLQGASSDPQDQWTLKEAKGLLLQSIQETRALMNEIGNPLLFDMGLQAACESLANRLMEKYPVRIHCNIGDSYKHLNPDMKTILYQVFRELLNNVVKHSQAQNAHVMIDVEDGHFRLRVTDDGAGFDPQTVGAPSFEGGYGLYSIRERLLAVGGSLRIESTPGTGTVVTAILPPAMD
jgi:PAS domain S-box-containing protein